MPLSNPYPAAVNSANSNANKIECDIDGADKSLFISLRPAKGTTQLIVLNLLKNLADDIRLLNITGFRIDGDEILSILTERRQLNDSQVERLGRTSSGPVGKIPTGIQHSRRRSAIREGTTEPSTQRSHAAKPPKRREQQDSKETAGE